MRGKEDNGGEKEREVNEMEADKNEMKKIKSYK